MTYAMSAIVSNSLNRSCESPFAMNSYICARDMADLHAASIGSVIRPLSGDDVPVAHRMEVEAYPADCAASLDVMRYRQSEAPELFLGYFSGSQLVAYMNASRYHEAHLTDDSMKMHIPTGESICIHSVVVDPSRRRQGIALQLLKEFISRARSQQRGAIRIILVCVAKHLPLYTRAGFTLLGPAHVKIGSRTWYECELLL